jgi:hypothetical protein
MSGASGTPPSSEPSNTLPRPEGNPQTDSAPDAKDDRYSIKILGFSFDVRNLYQIWESYSIQGGLWTAMACGGIGASFKPILNTIGFLERGDIGFLTMPYWGMMFGYFLIGCFIVGITKMRKLVTCFVWGLIFFMISQYVISKAAAQSLKDFVATPSSKVTLVFPLPIYWNNSSPPDGVNVAGLITNTGDGRALLVRAPATLSDLERPNPTSKIIVSYGKTAQAISEQGSTLCIVGNLTKAGRIQSLSSGVLYGEWIGIDLFMLSQGSDCDATNVAYGLLSPLDQRNQTGQYVQYAAGETIARELLTEDRSAHRKWARVFLLLSRPSTYGRASTDGKFNLFKIFQNINPEFIDSDTRKLVTSRLNELSSSIVGSKTREEFDRFSKKFNGGI